MKTSYTDVVNIGIIPSLVPFIPFLKNLFQVCYVEVMNNRIFRAERKTKQNKTKKTYRAHNQSVCQRSLVTETVTHISAVDSEFCTEPSRMLTGGRFFKPNARYERCCSYFKC